MAQMHFNTEGVDTESRFTPAPPGKYTLLITDSTIKASKADAANRYAAFTAEIVSNESKGRKLFLNFNLWHKKQDVTRMAEQDFARLCKACGKTSVQDTVELHNIPFEALIDVKVDERGSNNYVKEYIYEKPQAVGGVAPVASPAKAAPAQTAQAVSAGVPWGNG